MGKNSDSGPGRATALDETRFEIERFNSRMRHFHGVAVSVLQDAERALMEVWQSCQDPRTPEEIVDGVEFNHGCLPAGGWEELREKLHLLGHYLDYTRRLLDGSVDRERRGEEEEF
jgi:hypothetical protein